MSVGLATIALLPVLLVALAGVVEVGALRVLAARMHAAAELAALVAIDDQDEDELARSGRLRPSADASDVARAYFASNLSGSQALLARSASEVASSANVAVFADTPATDPVTGARYDRPTVRIIATVPVRTPILSAFFLSAVTDVRVRAAASAR